MNHVPGDRLDLARIVHDLRSPLMPLRTAAWLLRSELAQSPRAHELAGIVERQSARLARMMDELGDWGHVTDTGFALDCRPVDPALALDMAIGAIPGCAIEPHYTEQAKAMQLHADQHRFGQLLDTLIRHAMHRAGDRLPEMEVAADAGQLCIRVRDHGPPLPPAALEALLSQAQAPFDEGLGLRLLIARRIAEAHGGTLTAEHGVDGGVALACWMPASSG
ncbi:MAG: HAMP domain-containing histidine kinase [Lysobacteraceae bacterium]|nr:MAG: HAMP domain-containing histidine kinase [Xanthomonadaceae bacterium]